MKKLLLHGLLAALLLSPAAFANNQGPYYGGGKHTYSHGGTYVGGRGKSHKGGRYRGPTGTTRYGRHK